MTDYSRDRLGPDDEDRLPWLEPVEEEVEEGGVSTARLIMWAAIAILLVGIVLGGYLWLRGSDRAPSGDGALIKAPDAYYKERPSEEAAPSGGDEVVYSASKGNEVESMIDTSGAAETPVNVDRAAAPVAAAAPAPPASATPAPTAKPVVGASKPAGPVAPPVAAIAKAQPKEAKPAKPKPAPEPLSDGSMIQLGAFSSEAKANSAWKNLAARFSFLAGLDHSVVPVQSGDKTLYRLRASGGSGRDICGRLRTAGESCSVVG